MSVRSQARIPIHIFNSFSSLLGLKNRSGINPDEMLEIAAKRCGRDDFGDKHFLVGFRVLCRSLEKEAKLHAAGQVIAKNMLLNSLLCRLELALRWQERPEVLNEPVREPVIIVGPARGGTTLLFNLLALDDRFRFFQAWEARRPGISHENQKEVEKAKRKAASELRMMNYMRPELKKIHYMAAEEPEECNVLLTNSFEAIIFPYMFLIETYYDWYNEQTHRYAYSYYHKQLQWAQRYTPGKRWLLKTPSHLAAFKALIDQFPDAIIIHTHRDLLESLPSNCSLKYNLKSMMSYEVDKKKLGEFIMSDLLKILKTAGDVRAQNQVNVIDIQYDDLITNPMAVLKRIYTHIREDFTDGVQRRIMQYLSSNPKDKFGRHRYHLEEFGLDEKTLLEKFDFYYQSHGLNR